MDDKLVEKISQMQVRYESRIEDQKKTITRLMKFLEERKLMDDFNEWCGNG